MLIQSISRENVFIDYETNTWVKGLMTPISASDRSQNDVIANPSRAAIHQRWILNEDVTDNIAYVFDNRAFVMIQGPRKTTQFENNNPQQTITIQKDWFKQHLRKANMGTRTNRNHVYIDCLGLGGQG